MRLYKKYLQEGGVAQIKAPMPKINYEETANAEIKPPHLIRIDRKLFEESPNYRARMRKAKEIQEGIALGNLEVIDEGDGNYRYVATGKTNPDDTHELLFTAGVGLAKGLAAKGVKEGVKAVTKAVDEVLEEPQVLTTMQKVGNKIKQGVVGATDELAMYYAPRDLTQGTALLAEQATAPLITLAEKLTGKELSDAEMSSGKTVMGFLRSAQAGVPINEGRLAALVRKVPRLGPYVKALTTVLGTDNPINRLILKSPEKALAAIPDIVRFLRATGGADLLKDVRQGNTQGVRLDRPEAKVNVLQENEEALNIPSRLPVAQGIQSLRASAEGTRNDSPAARMSAAARESTDNWRKSVRSGIEELKSNFGFQQGGKLETIYLRKGGTVNKESMPCNKPRRTPGHPTKKFIVKGCENGKEAIIRFGDANMKIKKNDPERRKSFRARHNCDNPGSKLSARYWSCRNW